MNNTLPAGLSEQQKLCLAYLAENDGTAAFTTVSRAVAEEHGRLTRPQGRRTHRDRVTDAHAASFSRAVDRLADRQLVETETPHYRNRERRWIHLTAAGDRAGEELLRRHADGRYALNFEVLDT
jgi:DNA-binding MarR family transcriptional regulator